MFTVNYLAMKKSQFSLIFTLVFIFFFILATQSSNAVEISYPISALGNCASKEECKAYCYVPENRNQCATWAEDSGLIPKRENQKGNSGGNDNGESGGTLSKEQQLKDEEAQANAPGGCKGQEDCDAYCGVEDHFNECLDYSVKYGYMPKEEADAIREKVAKGGPGGCKGEQECRAYCGNPKNAGECMAFVVEEGTITKEEADFMVQQMSKEKPGKPKGNGPAEPQIKKEKVAEILKQKAGPGGCKNVEECQKYCMGGEHIDECMKFAEENQIMEPQEMEKVRKLSKIGGPGGCKNERECDAFCGKEENRDTCFNFVKDNGLISGEEIQAMQKQMEIIKKMENNKPKDRNQKQQQENRQNMRPQGSGPINGDDGGNSGGPSFFDDNMPPQSGDNSRMGPPPGFENMKPPEGMGFPPDGMMPPQGGASYQNGMQPPPGYENMRPPEGMMQPSGSQQFAPPPSTSGEPPPAPASPTSLLKTQFESNDLLSNAFIGLMRFLWRY